MSTTRDEEFRGYVLQRRAALLHTATLLSGGDRHAGEDLVQNTLTKLYLAWPAFRAAQRPDAYARRVMINALVDEERRPWRRRERTTTDLPDRPEGSAEDEPRAEEVAAALRELPMRMRAAVVFRYFDDMTVTETAQLLGCSEGTVKSQTARALDKLRRRLGAPLDVHDDVDEPEPATGAAPSPLHPVHAGHSHLRTTRST